MAGSKFLTIGALLSVALIYSCGAEPARKTSAEKKKKTPAETQFEATTRAWAKHVDVLKTRLPSEEFTILIEPPFIVIGDVAPKVLRQRYAEGTIRWAVQHLKALYFSKDPQWLVDIWLFKNRDSYDRNTKKLWNTVPTTPFGYYSPEDKVLVMNIGTGGGTLVHELVHPFMESNFPNCPAWFNEGLGSLYEQSAEKNGKIWGLTNWRLEGLQAALKSGGIPSFKKLTHTTTDEFYNRDPGAHYAQARYLLYYLQEKNLLTKYYHLFHRNQKDDPTGYKSLTTILGLGSALEMQRWQKEWEAYVLRLRFP